TVLPAKRPAWRKEWQTACRAINRHARTLWKWYCSGPRFRNIPGPATKKAAANTGSGGISAKRTVPPGTFPGGSFEPEASSPTALPRAALHGRRKARSHPLRTVGVQHPVVFLPVKSVYFHSCAFLPAAATKPAIKRYHLL